VGEVTGENVLISVEGEVGFEGARVRPNELGLSGKD
jgi:hypothetical protein